MLSDPSLSRRTLLLGTGGVMIAGLVPQLAHATPEDVQRTIGDLFGDRPMTDGRVSLTVPPIAENGNSVALRVDVDSPMTEDDHVRSIAIFANRNPRPNVIRFTLSPHVGRAQIDTRIRLRQTQTIVGIAEMSDGSLWAGRTETVITLAACVVL